MHAIYYDFETSDRVFFGQILTFAFISVDETGRITAELSGRIRISPLQLPAPAAIVRNGINVREHQLQAEFDEPGAMAAIQAFVEQEVASHQRVALIGYNSSRFDLPFLRTSLTRSGLNYHLASGVIHRDLYSVVRKLAATRPDFPRPTAPSDIPDGAPRLTLALEAVTRALGLLSGSQTHSARDDAVLAAELARALAQRFGIDVTNYDAYEPSRYRNRNEVPPVVGRMELSHEADFLRGVEVTPMVLVCDENSGALWCDLAKYDPQDARASIVWFSKLTRAFMLVDADKFSADDSMLARAAAARTALKGITIRNFFDAAPRARDIELEPHRLSSEGRELLHRAIWDGAVFDSATWSRDRDARVLYLRHQVAWTTLAAKNPPRYEEILKAYALYRYGRRGEGTDAPTLTDAGPVPSWVVRQQTYSELCNDLASLLNAAHSDPAVHANLEALRDLYDHSDITRIAASELSMPRNVQCAEPKVNVGT